MKKRICKNIIIIYVLALAMGLLTACGDELASASDANVNVQSTEEILPTPSVDVSDKNDIDNVNSGKNQVEDGKKTSDNKLDDAVKNKADETDKNKADAKADSKTEGKSDNKTDKSTATNSKTGTETTKTDNNTATTDKKPTTHTHSFVSAITKQPTCTAAGVKTFTCSCGKDSYTENIPATGHNFGNNNQVCLVCNVANPNYVHTHVFVGGTCTTPATCSCGATGNYGLHNWNRTSEQIFHPAGTHNVVTNQIVYAAHCGECDFFGSVLDVDAHLDSSGHMAYYGPYIVYEFGDWTETVVYDVCTTCGARK